jgi:hypothetical protein
MRTKLAVAAIGLLMGTLAAVSYHAATAHASSSSPQVGDVVLYCLTANDAAKINTAQYQANQLAAQGVSKGYALNTGNSTVSCGNPYDEATFPAFVTYVYPNGDANLHVFLDGIENYFVSNASQGYNAGQFWYSYGS